MRTMTRRWMRHTRGRQTYGDLVWLVGSRAQRPPTRAAVIPPRFRRSKEVITAGTRVAWMVKGYEAASLPKPSHRPQRLPT
jgi:hypothetical protein